MFVFLVNSVLRQLGIFQEMPSSKEEKSMVGAVFIAEQLQKLILIVQTILVAATSQTCVKEVFSTYVLFH